MEKKILEKLNDICLIVDSSGTIRWINGAVSQVLGHQPQKLVGSKTVDWGRCHQKINDRNHSENRREIWNCKHIDGSDRHLDCLATPYSGTNGTSKFLVVTRDISDCMERERQLREALAEKETLMKDLHHRVKNNLTMVSSLVALSAVKAEDPTSRDILDDLAARIRSISIIHEQLYRSHDLQHIDLSEYLETLLEAQLAGISGEEKRIQFVNKMAPIRLETKKCIPLGLIVTELATNSLKHAFRDRIRGTITMELHKEKNGLLLIYSDDGPGMPEGMDCRNSNSLGFTLLESLAKQLHAGLYCEHEGFFKLTLTVPVNWKTDT